MKHFHKKFIASSVVLALICGFVLTFTLINNPKSASAAWYTSGGIWNYRQKITIDHTKVPNTDQSNFPVLIKITDQNNPVFTKAKADGTDLLFTAEDQTSKLSWEIENFITTPGSRELDAWVKITTLSHLTDTIIYLYYGNTTAPGPTLAEKQAVWSNGYAGVWHLGETGTGITGDYKDSTSNSNNGGQSSNEPTLTTAQIGGGQNYNGTQSASGSYISVPSSTSLNSPNHLTLSAWIYLTGYQTDKSDGNSLIAKRTTDIGLFAPNPFVLYGLSVGYTGYPIFAISTGVSGSRVSLVGANIVNLNGWHLVTATYDGSIMRLYIDGVADNNTQSTNLNIGSNNIPVLIGAFMAQSYWDVTKGSIDETHISSAARSSDWVAAEYNNQNSPTTFYSMEGEVGRDMIAPSNPTAITATSQQDGGVALTSGNYYNYPAPYISWPAAEQAGGAHDTGEIAVSGVAGYYSYFGTNCGSGGQDPEYSRGLLADTGGGLHYSTDTSVAVPSLDKNENTYCLRIKTKDNASNVSQVLEAFIYKYDVTNPNAPSFVAVNPAGYSSVDSFEFSWPIATDVDAALASGLAGYQYKRSGSSGDDWSQTITNTKISNIKSYQTGENIFIVRSIDNAGNVSAQVQTTYYYSANSPSKPTLPVVDPEISDKNDFFFSWTAPVHSRPIVDYGYVVNELPTATNLTWTHSSSTTLAADHFATKQGPNTLYLVAKDDSGAYATDEANYAVFEFNCTTPAPPIPATVSIADSSDRLLERYMLTLQWQAGPGQESGSFGHYLIERSTDGVEFNEIATPTSTAYIDSGLSNAITYYYRIKTVDNAGSISAASTVVSKIPTGKYTTPPVIVSEPTVSVKATNATISWVVDRVSTASIRFGKSKDNLLASQLNTTTETDHLIKISGLEPNTKYYYQLQSLDVFRDYSLESAFSAVYSFDTLSAPSIANVIVSNITLTSADISWETTSASNTKVHFGSSANYGSILPKEDESMTTLHSIKLSNLAHTTKYHFKISGEDIDGNVLSSDDYVFDTLPMPTISMIDYQPDFSGPAPTVNITWITNVPTTSSVEYTPKASADSVVFEESQSALVSRHSVAISNMTNETEYNFTVSGIDQFGNKTISDLQVMKTSSDSRPPVISNVIIESSNVGSGNTNEARIIISWQSDELSTSQITYDEGISGNDYRLKTPPDTALTKNHIVIVSGLKPGTPYHFKIISADEHGNIARNQDQTVITGQVTESVFNILARTFNNLFGWLGKF